MLTTLLYILYAIILSIVIIFLFSATLLLHIIFYPDYYDNEFFELEEIDVSSEDFL